MFVKHFTFKALIMNDTLKKTVIESQSDNQACLILLHGLGANGYDFNSLPEQLHTSLPMRFVFPHAPVRPITLNKGQSTRAWFDVVALSIDAPEDKEGIAAANKQCHALIDEQIQLGIPANRIILGGFSQGAAMALYSGLRYPKTLGGIGVLSGYLPQALETQSACHSENKNTSIFIAHGSEDPILPMAFGQASCKYLKLLGHPVQWHQYPMAHEISTEELKQFSEWINQCLTCHTENAN